MTNNNVGKATTLQDCEACIGMTLTELETWNTANDDILGELEAFAQISGMDTTTATVVAVYTSYSDQPEGDMVDIDGWLSVDTADITDDWITEQVTATEATRMAKMPPKSDDDAKARNDYAHEIEDCVAACIRDCGLSEVKDENKYDLIVVNHINKTAIYCRPKRTKNGKHGVSIILLMVIFKWPRGPPETWAKMGKVWLA